MNRIEQIEQAAIAAYGTSGCRAAEHFVAGAMWADAHTNWISVEDELPPQNGRYIFYSDTMGVTTSYYYADILLNEHVTHWQHLPQPPKKGGEQ